MSFASPYFLLLLLVVPALALLLGARGHPPAITFSSLHILRAAGKRIRVSPSQPWWSWWFLPLIFAIIALARPQNVRTFESVKASGVEIMLAIDVSLSMNIDDFAIDGRQVNRITAAKKVMREFIAGRTSDRIGIVAFSGRPYTPSPLTLDQEWLQSSIDRITLGLIKESGTAIGSAIAAATRRLDQQEAESKIVVVLTDGANNSGNFTPEAAAKLARTLGIRVYTIAVGTPGVHRIRDPFSNRVVKVSQEFDFETLQAVANITGGAAYLAQNTESLQKIFSTIDKMEKTEIHSKTIVEADELFIYPASAAVISAILALALTAFLRPSP